MREPDPITQADDGYHYPLYQERDSIFWYTEWWYFAFTDPVSHWAAAAALAVFNPKNVRGLGACTLDLLLYPPGSAPIRVVDTFPLTEFGASFECPDVALGPSTLHARDEDAYQLSVRSRDGRHALELEFLQADAPRFMAKDVAGYKPWEVASWLAYMPSARVQGTLATGDQTIDLAAAHGYHDHNWGIWLLPSRTWTWAMFNAPEKELSFDLGVHAAFWFTTAYFRLGDLRLVFPGELLRYEPGGWASWKLLWRYPTQARVEATDSTGEYRLELTVEAVVPAVIWQAPVLLVEQTAHFAGTLQRRHGNGWKVVADFSEQGFFEITDTWLGRAGEIISR